MGAVPMPVPPIYDPEVVTELILYAAEHSVPELYAGGAAKALSVADAVARRLVEFALRKWV